MGDQYTTSGPWLWPVASGQATPSAEEAQLTVTSYAVVADYFFDERRDMSHFVSLLPLPEAGHHEALGRGLPGLRERDRERSPGHSPQMTVSEMGA